MFKEEYRNQVALLLRVLPIVNRQSCFALKGGTAINMFARNMQRLSVDIDLAYLPLKERNIALAEIAESIEAAAKAIEQEMPECKVQRISKSNKLLVDAPNAQIKIEPNTVFKGAVHEPALAVLCDNAQDEFDIFAKQFAGMTQEPVSVETLVQTRQQIKDRIQNELSHNERQFLLSLKQGTPNWQLLPIAHLEQLPAIQWKLRNIERMPKDKHQQSTEKLKRVLNL